MQLQAESVWWATLTTTERQELSNHPDQPLDEQPDLVVLGGGIVGLAAAYFAAEKGWKVQVLEANGRLAEDAEGNLGGIFPNAIHWRLSPITQQLAQTSRDWWAKLAVRPDFQVSWRVTGAVMVDESCLLPSPRAKMMELLEEGYSLRDVDAEQVALLEPQLRPLPTGGLQFPSEAVLHPLKAAIGFLRGIRRWQGRIATNCPVHKIHVEGGQIKAIDTSRGSIRPRMVIVDQRDQVAACLPQGSAPEEDSNGAGRVFLATEPTAPLLNRPVLNREWMLQLKSGELVVEAPVRGDRNSGNSSEDLATLVQQAGELLPALKSIPFVRSWSAMDATNSQHLPRIDHILNLVNAWSYRDLCGSQVLLAPIIGRLLTEWMATQQRPSDLASFAAT